MASSEVVQIVAALLGGGGIATAITLILKLPSDLRNDSMQQAEAANKILSTVHQVLLEQVTGYKAEAEYWKKRALDCERNSE